MAIDPVSSGAGCQVIQTDQNSSPMVCPTVDCQADITINYDNSFDVIMESVFFKTTTKPCPGDPLPFPTLAMNPGVNGIHASSFGCVRIGSNKPCTPPKPNWKMHFGIDIFAQPGTPLYAMYGGTSLGPAYHSSLGNYLVIKSFINGIDVWILYAHLNSISVSASQQINQGDNIGLTGVTGNANASNPHVHIEIFENQFPNHGAQVNPAAYLATKFLISGSVDPCIDPCN